MIKILTSIIVLTLLTAAVNNSYAQQVVSPISQLGIGEPYTNIGFINTATGGGGVSSWLNAANIENPASYSMMRYTTFEADLGTDIHNYTTNAGKLNYSKTGFRQFSLAMPTTKGLGALIAYMPYSRMGYAGITNAVDVAGDSVQYTNAGKGGINRGTLGLSYKFVNDSTFKLSSGFNINALFGEVLHQQRNDYFKNTQKFGALYKQSSYYTGANATLGVQAQVIPKALRTIYFGTAYTLETNAKTEVNNELISYTTSGSTFVYNDTVATASNQISYTIIPSTFTIGIGYGIKRASMLDADKYYMSLNYASTAWKTSSFGTKAIPFYDSKTISAAFMYNPQSGRKLRNNLRVGAKLAAQQWYYAKSFNDYSATISFGVPLPRIVSSLNVGYTIGSRKLLTTSKDIYHNISIAVLLNDIWFIKPKVD